VVPIRRRGGLKGPTKVVEAAPGNFLGGLFGGRRGSVSLTFPRGSPVRLLWGKMEQIRL
jgi:hypothetical protein